MTSMFNAASSAKMLPWCTSGALRIHSACEHATEVLPQNRHANAAGHHSTIEVDQPATATAAHCTTSETSTHIMRCLRTRVAASSTEPTMAPTIPTDITNPSTSGEWGESTSGVNIAV